jgi:hypothetical protein
MLVILTQCDADGMGSPGYRSLIETSRKRIRLNSWELRETMLQDFNGFNDRPLWTIFDR